MKKSINKYPAITYSMIGDYERIIFKKPEYGDIKKAYNFGRMVHQLVLKSRTASNLFDAIDYGQETYHLAKRAALAIKKETFARWLCHWSTKEKAFFWTDKTTGLPCKGTIEGIYKNNLIFDLKTTSAKTFNAFRRHCITFNYYRQAAFYLDGTGAKRFVIIGVQKMEPFKVFVIELTKAEIKEGRKKYKALLKHAYQNGYFDGFIHSSANAPSTNSSNGHYNTNNILPVVNGNLLIFTPTI